MAYEGIFTNWIITLESMGLLDVLLPFLLIFTLTFAVLQKSKILGEDSKRYNTLVSLVLALAAVIPHVIGRGPDVVIIINSALPNVSLLMIACLMAMLLIGVFGNDVNIAGTPLVGIVVIFSVIAIAWTFISAAGVGPQLAFITDPETRSLLIAILVFGLIVWFITKEEEPLDKRRSTRDQLNDWFGGIYKKK